MCPQARRNICIYKFIGIAAHYIKRKYWWEYLIVCKVDLSPYSTGNWVCVGYQTQMKSTQKTLNVHGQHENLAFGTQVNLYSADFCVG